MREAIELPIKMPRSLTAIERHDGTSFELSLVEAHRALGDIRETLNSESQAAPDDPSAPVSPYRYLDLWIAWVQKHCEVKLTQDEADWLWRRVEIERSQAARDFFSTLRSLNSTDSGPEDSATESA